MRSKLEIRKQIENIKIRYSETKNPELLIEAAILKGFYIALDGEKGIPLPSKCNYITLFSKIIFRYKLKSENRDKAYNYLYTSLMVNNKMPEYYIHKLPENNNDIANILTHILLDTYTDDINISHDLVYNIALQNLNEIGETRNGNILQCRSAL